MGAFLGSAVIPLLHPERNVAVSVIALIDLSRPSSWKGRRQREGIHSQVREGRGLGMQAKSGEEKPVTADSLPVSSGLSGLVYERQVT